MQEYVIAKKLLIYTFYYRIKKAVLLPTFNHYDYYGIRTNSETLPTPTFSFTTEVCLKWK